MTRTREVGSPADIVLELYNADGGKLVENDDSGLEMQSYPLSYLRRATTF